MGVATCLRWEPWIRMANLTSTHRHDFRWPTNNCLVPKADISNSHCHAILKECGDQTTGMPWCERDNLGAQVQAHRDIVQDQLWCQQQFMNLSSTKIRPHCGDDVIAVPQQHLSRLNQPNKYIQKVYNKYPRPFTVVLATPTDELKRRVYADRYRTTYQADYCTTASDTIRKMPGCDAGNAVTVNITSKVNGHVQDKLGCGRQAVKPKLCTSQIQPLVYRPVVSKNFHFSCCTPNEISRGEEGGPREKIPPWSSEYSDSIGRTARIIAKRKLYSKNIKKERCN